MRKDGKETTTKPHWPLQCDFRALLAVLALALTVGGLIWIQEELKIRDLENAQRLEVGIYEKALAGYRERLKKSAARETSFKRSSVRQDTAVEVGANTGSNFSDQGQNEGSAAELLQLMESDKLIYSKHYGYPSDDTGDGSLVTDYLANKKTGSTALVVRGERYCEDEAGSSRGFQKILKLISPGKEDQVLYTTERPSGYCNMGYDICCLDFSPDGKYLFFSKTGWEWSKPFMLNVSTGKYVIGDETDISHIGDFVWSESADNFALATDADAMMGRGGTAVYASEFNNPNAIRKIWSSDDRHNSSVTQLQFNGKNEISFEATVYDEKNVADKTGYVFDLQSGKLRED